MLEGCLEGVTKVLALAIFFQSILYQIDATKHSDFHRTTQTLP